MEVISTEQKVISVVVDCVIAVFPDNIHLHFLVFWALFSYAVSVNSSFAIISQSSRWGRSRNHQTEEERTGCFT